MNRGLATLPHLLVSETHRGRDTTTIERWQLDDGITLMLFRYSGFAVRVPREHREDPSSRTIALSVLAPGDWTLSCRGVPVVGEPDKPTLVAIDQSGIFDFRDPGTGSIIMLRITHARLTLSIETVQRGLANLNPGLPLYPLARHHLQQLAAIAVSDPRLLPSLSTSTVAVVRSLLICSADLVPDDGASDFMAAVKAFIEEHLDDADLSAQRIAAAHNISVRQLYKLWPAGHPTVGAHIMARRIARAASTLLTHRHLTIAAVARRHGFIDPTHFGNRFRSVHGVSPSEWRRRELVSIARE